MRRGVAWCIPVVLLAAGCSFGRTPAAPATVTVTQTATPGASTAAASPAVTAATTPSTSTPVVTAEPATLQSAFDDVRSGVVRLEVAGCDGGSIGTGFAVDDDLLVTAAHVVAGAQVVEVVQGTEATAGTVVGIDEGRDVALVRTTTELTGAQLDFSSDEVRVGDAVAAIGYPEGDALTLHPGTVNALGRKTVVGDVALHDLVEIDAATTHGDSGGPVVRSDGDVVGIVSAGPDGRPGGRLAVSRAIAEPLVQEWSADPVAVEVPQCRTTLDIEGEPVEVDSLPTDPVAQSLATLDVYFRALNSGDFPTAVAQTVEAETAEEFAEQVASSHDSDFSVLSAEQRGDTVVVWLQFTSLQDAGHGPARRPEETCTAWSLDYTFVRDAGLWLIDSSRAHEGSGSQPCG